MIRKEYENEVRCLMVELPEAFNSYERSGDPTHIETAYKIVKQLSAYLGSELTNAKISTGLVDKKIYKGAEKRKIKQIITADELLSQ